MRLTIEDVQRRMTDARTLLVDARGPERFEGKSETIDKVAGHIPGAHNHFYKWNLREDGTMRTPEDLRARYDALLGGRAPGEVVMYCGSGVSACHNLLAMEHAGLTGTPLYPGSWSEWSADPSRPTETGPAKK
jgi:thiosulfate/3-mercaptopyruvate sulfurtransferase